MSLRVRRDQQADLFYRFGGGIYVQNATQKKIYCFADLRVRQGESSQADKGTPILLTPWSLLLNTGFYLFIIYGSRSLLIFRLIPFL